MASWNYVEKEVNHQLDRAPMPIDVRFSSTECPQRHRIRHDVVERCGFRACCALNELSPEEHLKQCDKLEQEGYRPMGISAIEVSAKPGGQPSSAGPVANRDRFGLATAAGLGRRQGSPGGTEGRRRDLSVLARQAGSAPRQHLVQADDRRLRSALIERLAAFEVDVQDLVSDLDGSQPSEPSLRRLLLLVLASIPEERLPPELRKNLTPKASRALSRRPGSRHSLGGGAGPAQWKLDYGAPGRVEDLQTKAKPVQQLDSEGLAALRGKEWFITPNGQTMVVSSRASRMFLMGLAWRRTTPRPSTGAAPTGNPSIAPSPSRPRRSPSRNSLISFPTTQTNSTSVGIAPSTTSPGTRHWKIAISAAAEKDSNRVTPPGSGRAWCSTQPC